MTDAVELGEILDKISTTLDIEISELGSPMDGQSHRIYQLKYPRGEIWSLRIPKSAAAALVAKAGTAILNHLKKVQPTLQVPKPIYESKEYSLLGFLEGDTLGAWDSVKLTEQRRHQLLDSLATFLFDLWTAPVPQSACSISYQEWLRDEVDKAFRRSLRENSGWGDPLSFLCRCANMGSIIPIRDCLEVSVRHGDLNAWNILVNGTGVSGVIDWDTAQYVPMPAAAHHPLFIADIPGWSNDIPEGMTFREDRAYLEGALHKLARERLDVKGLWIADLLTSSFERQFFELSLRNKRINGCYIDTRLRSTSLDKAVVKEQLEAFLSVNPTLREDPDILKLRPRLAGSGNVLLDTSIATT